MSSPATLRNNPNHVPAGGSGGGQFAPGGSSGPSSSQGARAARAEKLKNAGKWLASTPAKEVVATIAKDDRTKEAISFALQSLVSHGTGVLSHATGGAIPDIQGLDPSTWGLNEHVIGHSIEHFAIIAAITTLQAKEIMGKTVDKLLTLRKSVTGKAPPDDVDEVLAFLEFLRANLNKFNPKAPPPKPPGKSDAGKEEEPQMPKNDKAMIQKTTLAPTDDKNVLEYVMSDDTVDRMGDIIEPEGWVLGNFKKNPIALFGHDSKFIVGNWRKVRVEGRALRGELELMDPVTDRLREINTAVKAGILRGVSVGFRPLESVPIENSKPGGRRFTKSELIECSLVGIPANPNALQVAKSLNLSADTMSMIFGEHANEDRCAGREIGEYDKLHALLEEWSPDLAREFKLFAAREAKNHPYNPKYRKFHRLMDEIETLRTISLVSAEHGNKGRAA